MHLNLSRFFFFFFPELGMQRAEFSLEVLHIIHSDSNDILYQKKATVHDVNGGTTEKKDNTLKWLLLACWLSL